MKIDLGNRHALEWTDWSPDLELNPQYAYLADKLPARFSAVIYHLAPDGSDCAGAVTLDTEVSRLVVGEKRPVWQVDSWEPLTLSPSILCRCGDHGYIRNGHWETA